MISVKKTLYPTIAAAFIAAGAYCLTPQKGFSEQDFIDAYGTQATFFDTENTARQKRIRRMVEVDNAIKAEGIKAQSYSEAKIKLDSIDAEKSPYNEITKSLKKLQEL